jgi:8-oxo-dGTP pyrophosphatase MutT (NUDIX family)
MTQYNIRVYGIWQQAGKVLVSDEYMKGIYMTKFPGGGHEMGESLPDALIRECMEEMNLPIQIKGHFYTTDFYIASAFSASQQLISVYYFFEPAETPAFSISEVPFDFDKEQSQQSFRWLDISQGSREDFTFPIDQKVFEMLKEIFQEQKHASLHG